MTFPSMPPPAAGSSKPCKTSPVPGSVQTPPPGAIGGRTTPAASCIRLHSAQQSRRSPIPHHPNYLQVILDIRYQYAIMVSSIWHGSSVPCEPCAPATRSFHPCRYLHVCPSCFLANSSLPTVPLLLALFSIDYTLFHLPYPISPLLVPA